MSIDTLKPLVLSHEAASYETLRDMREFLREFGSIGLESLLLNEKGAEDEV